MLQHNVDRVVEYEDVQDSDQVFVPKVLQIMYLVLRLLCWESLRGNNLVRGRLSSCNGNKVVKFEVVFLFIAFPRR